MKSFKEFITEAGKAGIVASSNASGGANMTISSTDFATVQVGPGSANVVSTNDSLGMGFKIPKFFIQQILRNMRNDPTDTAWGQVNRMVQKDVFSKTVDAAKDSGFDGIDYDENMVTDDDRFADDIRLSFKHYTNALEKAKELEQQDKEGKPIISPWDQFQKPVKPVPGQEQPGEEETPEEPQIKPIKIPKDVWDQLDKWDKLVDDPEDPDDITNQPGLQILPYYRYFNKPLIPDIDTFDDPFEYLDWIEQQLEELKKSGTDITKFEREITKRREKLQGGKAVKAKFDGVANKIASVISKPDNIKSNPASGRFADEIKKVLATQNSEKDAINLLKSAIQNALGDKAPNQIHIKMSGGRSNSWDPFKTPYTPTFDPDTGEPIWPDEEPDIYEPWPRRPRRRPERWLPEGPVGGDINIIINNDGTIIIQIWINGEWVTIHPPAGGSPDEIDPRPGNYPHPDPPPNNNPRPDGTYPWDDPMYDPYA